MSPLLGTRTLMLRCPRVSTSGYITAEVIEAALLELIKDTEVLQTRPYGVYWKDRAWCLDQVQAYTRITDDVTLAMYEEPHWLIEQETEECENITTWLNQLIKLNYEAVTGIDRDRITTVRVLRKIKDLWIIELIGDLR